MERFCKTISISSEQPVFKGHFPGRPILPGVFMLSFLKDVVGEYFGASYRLKRIIKQKFINPVVPDCELLLDCTIHNKINQSSQSFSAAFSADDKQCSLMVEADGFVSSVHVVRMQVELEPLLC